MPRNPFYSGSFGSEKACIAADEIVTVRESELLRVIAAVLECPLPPLPAPAVPSETS